MYEWHSLPEKDGDHYFFKLVDVYRDDGLIVDYEIYKNEELEPVIIDFFEKEIEEIVEKIKEAYRNEENHV